MIRYYNFFGSNCYFISGSVTENVWNFFPFPETKERNVETTLSIEQHNPWTLFLHFNVLQWGHALFIYPIAID